MFRHLLYEHEYFKNIKIYLKGIKPSDNIK
jgi:hypothetical protein